MATVDFIALSPDVLATAPACPTLTILREVRNAARELCERAKCYRVDVENEPVASGEVHFYFYMPDNTQLVAPIDLTLNGDPLLPSSPQLLNEVDPEWRSETGQPCRYIRSTENIDAIRLYPIPEQAYATPGLYGEIAVKPTRAATNIEELFLDRYHDALVAGALSRLLMIPKKPWSDPGMGGHYKNQFEQKIIEARNYASGDDMPKRRTVKYGGL